MMAAMAAMMIVSSTAACGGDQVEPGTLAPSVQATAPDSDAEADADPAETSQTADQTENPDQTEPATRPGPDTAAATNSEARVDAAEVRRLVPEVLAVYPHDITAYTQGFELADDGTLIEGTGRTSHPGGNEIYGSDLRRIDIESGQVLDSVRLPDNVFGEGTTIVGDTIVQISWKDEVVFFWDAQTFEQLDQMEYDGTGWGLCYDGERLVMTDGSANLFFRNPDTFELVGSMPVTLDDQPLSRINELECLNGTVWANVYQTDQIVAIDPDSGQVTAVVDASALEQPRVRPTEVLNGIAWDQVDETWLVTGKFWPNTYRVNFVPAG